MKHRGSSLSILVSSFLVLSLVSLQASKDEPPRQATETITAAELSSILEFLASDEMQGRDTGSTANRIASRYLAHQFKQLGLQPGGDGQSYFQYFSLAQAELSKSNSLEVRQGDTPLETGIVRKDFYPSRLSAEGRIEGELVFAGYGITAPEMGYDDYQHLEVSGKIVLVLSGEPGESDANSPFEGVILSEYGRELHKILNAQKHGAAAVLLAVDHRSNFPALAQTTWPEDISRSRYTLTTWTDQIQIPAVYLSPKMTAAMRGNTDLQALRKTTDSTFQPQGRPLGGVQVALEVGLTRHLTRARNVVAVLPGSDPERAREAVVVSAHFDHVGLRDGDIFNGADDDGSGTVGVLEIAEAFVASRRPPRRSVVFALWNAEEQGLLGSRYYVRSPRFPLSQTVAMYQMDMIGRNQEIPGSGGQRFRGLAPESAAQNNNSVHLIGYSRSSDLRSLVQRKNRQMGLDLRFELDQHPISLMTRSDHWPFLVAGVPALFFTTGLHPDYHRPGDTADRINYVKLEKVVRLVFQCAWSSANLDGRPGFQRWTPDSP